MNTKFQSETSQKGFTLVELSIVLVIIGLLIGGILVAQSMIGTAKLQSTVRQLGQFDAAVANFYTKFNQIPGDSSLTGATPGNNDGYIQDGAASTNAAAASSCAATATFNKDMGKFWYDLSLSGLKTTGTAAQYTDSSGAALASTSAGTLVNTYIPKAPIGSNLGYFACSTAGGTTWYVLGALSTGAAGVNVVTPASGLKGSEAVAIDSKIDDGYKDGGSVQGTQSVATIAMAPGTGTTAYTIGASDVANSTLFVRLGVQTGNLQ